jgi:hypothetical protein
VISCRLAWWSTSQPFFSQSFKDTFIPHQEDLRSVHDGPQERMLLGQLRPELGLRIHRRVDFPPQPVVGRVKGGHDLAESRLADDHQVHVAGRMGLAAGLASVDKSHGDLSAKGAQELLEGLRQAERLCRQTPQFAEHGASGIGLVVLLPPFGLAGQHAHHGQASQFAADIGGVLPQERLQLPAEVSLVRVGEDPPEDSGPQF